MRALNMAVAGGRMMDAGRSAAKGQMTAERGSSEERTAYLLLTGMAIFFGGTWVTGAWAVAEVPPLAVAAMRFGLASVLLYAWLRMSGRRLARLTARDLPIVAGLGLTAIAGYNYLFLTGLTLAPATDGAIIVPGLAPVFTVALAGLVLGERLGLRGVAGLAVAIVGLVLVVGPGGGAAGGDRLLGDVFFIGGALLWAVYSVLARIAGARFDAVSATFWGTLIGTVVLLPLGLLEGGVEATAVASVRALFGIGYLAVFGTVLAFVFLHLGIARIGAARASAFALVVPIVGVLSSVWLLDERLSPMTLVGGLVVLAGLWLVQTRPHAAGARTAPAGSSPSRA